MYVDLDLFYDNKLKEQCEWRDAEISAMRRTIAEQHQALKEIYSLKQSLTVDGKYYAILRHVKDKLDRLFNVAESHIGNDK